jgi:hypothetical protein
MGAEARCTAHLEGQSSEGTALLETDFVLFRGSFRVKVPFKSIRKLSVSAEQLVIVWEEGTLKLDLGAAAGKWLRKIENPPSLMDKLGVKPGMSVCVIGIRDESFLEAVRSIASGVGTRLAPKSDMIIAAIESSDDLEMIAKAEANLAPVVRFPEGSKAHHGDRRADGG